MSNDEIVHTLSLQIDALQLEFDLKHANELDMRLWEWLQLCNPSLLVGPYNPTDKNVRKETLLLYLNVRASLYLNQMNIRQIEMSLNIFERIIGSRWPYDNLLIYHFILKAEYLIRRGKFTEAKRLLDDIKPNTRDERQLAMIYAKSSNIDNNDIKYSWLPYSKITDISKGIGFAEQSDDKNLISKLYSQLGVTLQRQYPSLALSMNWKAQVMAEKAGDKYLSAASKLQRVYEEVQIFMKYNDSRITDTFKKDMEMTINSIDRETLPTESLKAFYDETRSFAFDDPQAEKRALDYFRSHGVYDKVYFLAEQLAGKALFKHVSQQTMSLLKIAYSAALKMGDKIKIQRMEDAIKRVEHDELERKTRATDTSVTDPA